MESSNANLLLLQRFSTKRQLYGYMSQRLKVFLPPISECRMEWLRQVFSGEKHVVLLEDVPQYTVPTQPQLNVKLIYHELEGDAELMRFFDTDRVEKSGKYPSRPFFWGILFAFRKQLCTALVQEVMDAKLMRSEQLQHASQNLNFQKVWVDKLLEHPMANTQGSSSRQTNLLYQMQQARQPPRRVPIQAPQTIQQYKEQMNIPISRNHVTVRKKEPNVIRNQSEDEEWKQDME